MNRHGLCRADSLFLLSGILYTEFIIGGVGVRDEGFFAASNSGRGFKNYYTDVFGISDRIFVIKGGPGTGKSRFMNDVAEYSTARGWVCERYYCSSDPNSLDGIKLFRDGKVISVIDGTPPHAWEPQLPGVRDEIVNLGDFWDSKGLLEHADEIRGIEKRKNELWRAAYSWLSGSLDMCRTIKEISIKYIDGEGLRRRAQELLSDVRDGNEFKTTVGLISSVGMYGEISLKGYYRLAKRICAIEDCFMSAHLLLTELLALARTKKLSVRVSYDPVDSERLDGVYFEESGLFVGVGKVREDRDFEILYMSELCHPDYDAIRSAEYADSARRAMLGGACDTLDSINSLHFRLEKIYSSAMDFAAKEAFTREFCKKNFGV